MYSNPEHLSIPPDQRPLEEQPHWRRDFPIDQGQDAYVARRDFVRFMILTSAAFTTGQFWIIFQNIIRRNRSEPVPQQLIAVDALSIGGIYEFTYPTERDACILMRLDATHFVAYDRRCTHLLCPVIPHHKDGAIHCPCHEGHFDLATGRPIAGPPQRPLTRIVLDIRDGVIFATGLEEQTL